MLTPEAKPRLKCTCKLNSKKSRRDNNVELVQLRVFGRRSNSGSRKN
jgi:hypothetical protein